jgi:hypothetical protein
VADRIAHGRRHKIGGMRGVHVNVADIVILVVDNGDVAVVPLQNLKAQLHCKGERRRIEPALV